MATPGRVAKRTQRQIEAILIAIEELKAQSRAAEFDDGGILEEIKDKGILVGIAIGSMADEMVKIKAEIAEQKIMQLETNIILNSLRADIADLQPNKRRRKSTVTE